MYTGGYCQGLSCLGSIFTVDFHCLLEVVVRVVEFTVFEVGFSNVHVNISTGLTASTIKFDRDAQSQLVKIDTFGKPTRRVKVGQHRIQVHVKRVIRTKVEIDFPEQSFEGLQQLLLVIEQTIGLEHQAKVTNASWLPLRQFPINLQQFLQRLVKLLLQC